MNKFKKLLCGLFLVPCVLVGSACSKDTKVTTEGYTKALQNSAQTFYNTKFYPNSANSSLVTSPITFIAEREAESKTKKTVDYNHVDNGDGSVSSHTQEYYEVITTEVEETITFKSLNQNSSGTNIEINNVTTTTKTGLRATADDKNVEKYTEVAIERNNIVFIYNEEGSTIYKSTYTKDSEGEETVKTYFKFTDVETENEEVFDFYDAIDESLIEPFFNFDLELIIIGGKLYKDGSSFGYDAGYSAASIDEDKYTRVEYEMECDFKNNLPSKYSMKITNQTKSFMNLNNSEGEMESSIEIKYSAKDITAPTGYEETNTMISLEAISLGY